MHQHGILTVRGPACLRTRDDKQGTGRGLLEKTIRQLFVVSGSQGTPI